MDASTENGDGYPREIFRNESGFQIADVECRICLNICNNPKQCPNGHMFCNKCILSALDNRKKCPCCSIALNEKKLSTNLLAKSMINTLSIRCPAPLVGEDDTCSWTGTLSTLTNHINTCEYKSINCNYCDELFIRRDLNTHIESCTSRPQACTNLGCNEAVKLKDITMHYEVCHFALVSCPLHLENLCGEICPKMLLRKDVDAHLSMLIQKATSARKRLREQESARTKGDEDHTDDRTNGRRVKKTVRYDNGDVYDGLFKGDARHGRGKLKFANRNVYEGQFVDDKMCGKGVYRYAKGAIYEGEFMNDRINGRGVYTWANGAVYEGEWKDDKMDGRGKFKFVSGDICEGDWKDDRMNGQGVCMFANGDVYEGEYKGDKRHGQGVFRFACGEVYEGSFECDKMSGHGVYHLSNGSVHEGGYKNNKSNGHGVYRNSNGDVYEGNWKDGKMSGHGVYRLSSGDVYEGEFKFDKRHGHGVIKGANGDVSEVEYRNGVLVACYTQAVCR